MTISVRKMVLSKHSWVLNSFLYIIRSDSLGPRDSFLPDTDLNPTFSHDDSSLVWKREQVTAAFLQQPVTTGTPFGTRQVLHIIRTSGLGNWRVKEKFFQSVNLFCFSG